MNFKKGDKVEVVRVAQSNENGWGNSWEKPMDDAVGKIGVVEFYQPQQKNVAVHIEGLQLYGYPEFILKAVNENKIKLGDTVTVTCPVTPTWNGEGEVVSLGKDSSSVLMKTGAWKGSTGRFRNFDLRPIVPNVIPAPAPVKSLPSSQALMTAKNIAVSLAKNSPSNTVNIDQVQNELRKLGYSPSDLGNSAGTIFKSGLFQNTGNTINSTRPGNRGRRVIVWKFIGDQQTSTFSVPDTRKYVIEYRSKHGQWERSGNIASSGDRSLWVTNFTHDEAVKEAAEQQRRMGSSYQYRAVLDPNVPPVEFIIEYRRKNSSESWARSYKLTASGKFLHEFTFRNKKDAEDEATRQNKLSIGNEYRAVEFVPDSK